MIQFVVFMLLLTLPIISAAAESDGHWGYEGEEGPEHWAEISDDYALCADGMNQSPIDLVADHHTDLPELVFDYHETPLREENNGHTIQLNIAPGNMLRAIGTDYNFEVQQVHFHSPSEHTVSGKSYAMEIHLVHKDANGFLAVVGVLIDEGEENPVLNRIWSFMPEKAGEAIEAPISISEARLLPPTREYFTYNGSLTTPPCSEGVTWIVLKQSIEASGEQIQRFKDRVGQWSNRPIQSHNARMILD